MPTYVYVCEQNHEDEAYRSMSRREDPKACPECDGPMRPVLRRGKRPDLEAKNARAVSGLLDHETGRRYHLRAQDCHSCEYDEVVEAWMGDDGMLLPPGPCPKCGGECRWEHLTVAFGPTMMDTHFNNGGGVDIQSGRHFGSKREFREFLARNEFELTGGQMKSLAKKRAAEQRAELDKVKRDHNEYIDNLERDAEGRAALRHLRAQAAQGAFGPQRTNPMLERMK